VAPQLLSPKSGLTSFDKDKPNDMVTTMVWNYAAYSGTATTVSYSIEFAAAGNQMCPTVVATSMERFKNFTVGELNAALAGFALC
jgi:hypothetical protein